MISVDVGVAVLFIDVYSDYSQSSCSVLIYLFHWCLPSPTLKKKTCSWYLVLSFSMSCTLCKTLLVGSNQRNLNNPANCGHLYLHTPPDQPASCKWVQLEDWVVPLWLGNPPKKNKKKSSPIISKQHPGAWSGLHPFHPCQSELHTQQVLREKLRLSDDELSTLRQQGVIA